MGLWHRTIFLDAEVDYLDADRVMCTDRVMYTDRLLLRNKICQLKLQQANQCPFLNSYMTSWSQWVWKKIRTCNLSQMLNALKRKVSRCIPILIRATRSTSAPMAR